MIEAHLYLEICRRVTETLPPVTEVELEVVALVAVVVAAVVTAVAPPPPPVALAAEVGIGLEVVVPPKVA